ncbi:uncharacterized protein LOC143038867 [Oratosquilla oratoria]|uniref:uncharacterized protein LOC143038867 n=1 Tax=Oratosquilla oratoria TaxID=337810 RepID=UPI003F765910
MVSSFFTLCLQLAFFLLALQIQHMTAVGPFWDAIGSTGVDVRLVEAWGSLNVAGWAQENSRLQAGMESLAITKASVDECLLLCKIQASCMSVGIQFPNLTQNQEAQTNGTKESLGSNVQPAGKCSTKYAIPCFLSNRRGHPDFMVQEPGFIHFHRPNVARIGDWCRDDRECSTSDIYTECIDHTCVCKEGTNNENDVCKPPCPEDWLRVELPDRTNCYYLSKKKILMQDAVNECDRFPYPGVLLADIESEQEQRALEVLLTRHLTYTDRVLVGLNDLEETGVYRFWGRLNESLPEFVAWGAQEPNNPVEHCVVMYYGYRWRWADVNCNFEYIYLCKFTADV